MSKIITLNNLNNDEVLNDIINNEIIVIEDVQASKLIINWDGESFIFRPKRLSNDPLNITDLALQKYYNPAINYFNSMDFRVRGLMPKNYNFVFEYFPDENPANIEYQKIPKNNLVLTTIIKGGKYVVDIDEISEYATLFGTDMLPVIFKGKLRENQIEVLKYFLNTSEDDLEYVFGNKSFAFLFYKILNPVSDSSFLMDGENFQKNLEKLIIRVKDKDISFEILNPLYKRISDTNSTEFAEVYTLILVNFLNFCQSIDMGEIKLKGDRKEEAYIYLMCKLYNIYVAEVKDDLLNFEFIIPDFYDKDKFKINKELISNKLTKEYINESDKLEYIFKIVLSSFSKKRKKPIGVFTDNTVILFNKFVEQINTYIEKYLNKIHEVELNRAGLVDFTDYFSIKYDQDADNQVYPDIYGEFEKQPEENKKKGKGGKLPTKK